MANQATGALNADGLMSYAGDKQLKGLPGAAANYLKNSFVGKGLDALGNMMPVNKRAIYENELLGQGFRLNDIGQVVSDGGNINTAQNIMAGYNAAKVDADTFAKRRAVIEKNMKDPVQKAAKLKALAEAEAIMLGTAKDRADMIFDDKSLAKDPSYKSLDEKIKKGLLEGDDDDDEFDPTNPLKIDPISKKNAITNKIFQKTINDIKQKEIEKQNAIDPPTNYYVPDGTSGGGAGQGIDISGAGTVRSSDNNFQGDSGPTNQQESDYGYSTDFGFARGGRVKFLNGGLADLVYLLGLK